MGAVMASTDWRSTPLGDPSGWTPALRTAAGLCLECRFPMLIMWGPELAMIYNDPFRPILAEKHPRSMGQPGAECWAEIWDVVGPMLHGVLDSGTTVWSEDQLMVLDRRGFEEDCYFTFSYSPIRSHRGDIEGVLVTVFETTDQVVGERRMSCLRELAEARADAGSSVEVLERAATVSSAASRRRCRSPACTPSARREWSRQGCSAGCRERLPLRSGRCSRSSPVERRCRSRSWTRSCGSGRPTRGRVRAGDPGPGRRPAGGQSRLGVRSEPAPRVRRRVSVVSRPGCRGPHGGTGLGASPRAGASVRPKHWPRLTRRRRGSSATSHTSSARR